MEDLVNLETAILAKELNFNLDTYAAFRSGEYLIDNSEIEYFGMIDFEPCDLNRWEAHISRPTQSLLVKWLREKHGINLWVETIYHDGFNYYCNAEFMILDFFESMDDFDEWYIGVNHDIYEDALEEGLIVTLKLIKDKK